MSFKISDCVKIDLSGRPDHIQSVTSKEWKPIAAFNAPFSLNLSWTTITDSDLQYLAGQKYLIELRLISTEITDQGLSYLAEISHLEDLDLSSTKVTDEGFVHLAKMANLRKITMKHLPITGEWFGLLKQLPYLRAIYLWGCSHLSETGMKALATLIHLRELELTYTNINDTKLELLRSLTALEWLGMGLKRILRIRVF